LYSTRVHVCSHSEDGNRGATILLIIFSPCRWGSSAMQVFSLSVRLEHKQMAELTRPLVDAYDALPFVIFLLPPTPFSRCISTTGDTVAVEPLLYLPSCSLSWLAVCLVWWWPQLPSPSHILPPHQLLITHHSNTHTFFPVWSTPPLFPAPLWERAVEITHKYHWHRTVCCTNSRPYSLVGIGSGLMVTQVGKLGIF